MSTVRTKIHARPTQSSAILRAILEELRMLRSEVEILLPREGLKDYAHPHRIKRSYHNALRQHPLG